MSATFVQLIGPATEITLGSKLEFKASDFQPIAGSTSYTYRAWFTINASKEDAWISLIHRGDTETARFPGLWLCADDPKHLHVKASTTHTTETGYEGIEWSKSKTPLNEAFHVAIVADSSNNHLTLLTNGVVDCSYEMKGSFLSGDGHGCCVGKDKWHGESAFTIEDLVVFGQALNLDEVRQVMMRSRPEGSAPPNPLPTGRKQTKRDKE